MLTSSFLDCTWCHGGLVEQWRRSLLGIWLGYYSKLEQYFLLFWHLLSMQTLPINVCQRPITMIFFITPRRCVQVLEVSCDRGGVCVDSQSHVAVIISWENLSTKKRKVPIGWENLSIEKEDATPLKDKRDCVNRFELSEMRNKTRLKPFDLKFIFIYNNYSIPLTKKLLRFFSRSVTFFTTFMGGI